MPKFEETVDFDVEVIRTTDAAILVKIDGEDDVWMPKSQIDSLSDISEDSEVGDTGTITVSEWIAVEKGLV